MTVILTENGEENDDARDRRVGGRHGGVRVVTGGRSRLGGAIQHLEVGD